LLFVTSSIAIHCSLFTDSALAQLAGKITKVEGRVDILRAGAVKAVPVKVGDAVSVKDIIRTKSDGKAEITFIDNTAMTVGPRSRLGIDEYLYKPDAEKRTASLKLYRGRTGFQIPRPVYAAEGSKFEMKTRTAVAGVRGTEGILYTDGIERVYVKDGLIEFTNPAGTVMVTAGSVGEVFYGQAPTERPFTLREYEQQQRQISPAPPAEAPPAEVPPPVAAPPVPTVVAAPLPPPPGTEPPLPPAHVTVPSTKVFNVSASILDGEIIWGARQFEDVYVPDWQTATAAFIQSGSVSGTFNRTILEGGYYGLNINGYYDRTGIIASDNPTYLSSDTEAYFFYSGSTSDGKSFYGVSGVDILRNPLDGRYVHPNKLWDGINAGGIEDGPNKYWFIGYADGNYTSPIFNNTISPLNTSGTFSVTSAGLFWDGSRPFWEQLSKVIPTIPAFKFDVPITEIALRTFDISASGTLSLASGVLTPIVVGSMSTTASGQGVELTPGSGLWDMNVKGSWSASTPITNLTDIEGSMGYSTTIGTSGSLQVSGGVAATSSNTAIVAAGIEGSRMINANTDVGGVMVGKMAGSTSGTFDGKAIGYFEPPPPPPPSPPSL
jgi:hypothetical protein